ncbi:MAG: hypothetical protein O7B25_07390 [Gammaproteobacteria bacterium]|nr:hypothetical protein [Gammaproteobacteria bacterium]
MGISGAAMVYPFTFVLAFCSLVYELLLGQSLSAFLGNTVLRYSVTIGLYMLSMGIGSLLAEGRLVRHPVISLQRIEVALAVTGGFCVLFLHVLDMAGLPTIVFSAFAHFLIVVIGILTGFEIPILMELRKLHAPGADNTVLGVDYLGAFVGTLVFAFVFFPIVGLVPSAFFVAALNAAVGVGLITQAGKVHQDKKSEFRALLGVQSALLIGLLVCLAYSRRINEFFLAIYLGI